MLLDKTELDKSLADVQRSTGQCGVEDGGSWRAGLERQLHQFATNALALVIVADDNQADGGIRPLGTRECCTDQVLAVFDDEAFSDALQHGPIFQAVRPFQSDRQGVGRRHIGTGHWAVAKRDGHGISPLMGLSV
ncbi:hypothetical protein D9M71_546630 [compost metagenome]